MDHTVFIQTNHKQITGAIVAEYALRRYSSHNDKFDVHIIDNDDAGFSTHRFRLATNDPRHRHEDRHKGSLRDSNGMRQPEIGSFSQRIQGLETRPTLAVTT